MLLLLPGVGTLRAADPTEASPDASGAAVPRRGGTLVFAVSDEPPNYDCHQNVSFAFIHPVAPHYSTLLKFDAAEYPQVKGDLAESWSVAPNGRSYTFKLHPGVLFHDGSPLTAEDVKASYERIIDPPAGVRSPRRAAYAAIESIETPDPRTVIFRLRWPEASMLAGFASPWNCIYRAAKLREDPKFPERNILGTGAFRFAEHVAGKRWTGRRWDQYFRPQRPYLDGYEVRFMTEAASVDAMRRGEIAAQFRSVTPRDRDRLMEAMGPQGIAVSETPWLLNLLLVFNAKRPPFDNERVRRALSLAVDRWKAAETLSATTFLRFVGGVLRPGYSMATPERELAALPGFSHDIEASRAEARRLLAEAGANGLKLTLVNRDIEMPYGPGAAHVLEAWRAVGVDARMVRLGTKEWQTALDRGEFEAAIDFQGDYFDDPTLQLAKYVSADLSPGNHSGASDSFLDALYVGQAVMRDVSKRAEIVRDFERHALTKAYAVPLLWWNRIIALSPQVKGWTITPSHYIEQDLTDVWLEP
jgi:peptide/nickel transport system substrate-binding protein